MSTYSGVAVDKLVDYVGTEKSAENPYLIDSLKEIDTFWLGTEGDKVINSEWNKAVTSQLKRSESYVYPKELGISHNITAEPIKRRYKPEQNAVKKTMHDRLWSFFEKF